MFSFKIISSLLASVFLGVLFLQSGIDKISDRKGNLEWLQKHFSNSMFRNVVPMLLLVLTLFELATGLTCFSGIILLTISGNALLAKAGALLSGITILMLFTGQRLAKDYAGAASLVGYFILSLMALYFAF